ncbi:hypothetical protein ACJ72_06833 [Emergomyces africanus]|uniref:Uncharacterized protein n=1 Tax=Emergomyces africanus TaxID=1955775 RepID=A0A1B7NPZ3_9EURO|nr:hypothetical protein ACJ72_06833 [Emergomyces africanus]
MSLKTVYEQFLAEPAAASLSADAALNYITTTTSFFHPEPIIKHITSQSRVLKKKSEKIINAVEGAQSLCLDVETSLEFTSGGGAYLLELDDNFIVDRVVTLPIVHIVHFDSDERITQIRLYWDQGSLLKQLDIIGSSHRNWPIREASEQSRLINSSVSAAAKTSTAISSPASLADKRSITTAASNASFGSMTSPSKRFTKDPHASLSLFQPHSPPPEERPVSVASRASAKPPPRDYGDLFVGDDAESTPTKKSSQPQRMDDAVAPKGGAGHNYKPSRLFVDDDEAEQSEQVNNDVKSVKTNAKKYNHFEFGETPHPGSSAKPQAPNHFEFGEAEPPALKAKQEKHNHFEIGDVDPSSVQNNLPLRPHAKKHLSQWDFEDFVTPEKPRQKVLAQNVRNFGWSDDEADTADSPPKQRRAPQPRRDAQTHFELRDDGTPIARLQNQQLHPRGTGGVHNKGQGLYENNLYDDSGTPVANQQQKPEQKLPVRVAGAAHNKGLGLYENNLYDDSGTPIKVKGGAADEAHPAAAAAAAAAAAPAKVPLGNVSNVHANTVNRRKDFDSHWTMMDSEAHHSSETKEVGSDNNGNENGHNDHTGKGSNENRRGGSGGGGAMGLDRKKAVQMMDSSWDTFGEEAMAVEKEKEQEIEMEKEKFRLAHAAPAAPAAPAVPAPSVGVSGKRMSRDVNKRSWGFGDDGF